MRTGELFGTGDEAVSQSQGQASEFESFVEHALSPLGHYGQESPSQQPFSQRSIESHVGIGLSQSIEGSQLSMGVPTSNDWSPSVAAGSSLPAGNDLKSFFGDSVLNSPIVPHPRMRHKGLKGQADYTADFSVVLTSTSTATSHNLGQGQGIAERQGADGPQAQVAKRTGPPTSNKRPRDKQQQQQAAEPLQMEAPTRRSGRSKVPSKDYAEFELGDFTASSEPDAARAFAPVGAPSIGVTKARSPRPAAAASSSSSARASAGGGRFSSSSTLMSPSGGVVRCHCKKSRCLKLYCECLHALKLCSGCSCFECENNASNPALTDIIEGIREVSAHLVAIVCVLRPLFLKPLFSHSVFTLQHLHHQQQLQQQLQRNPDAFSPRVDSHSKAHAQGCHCRKSSCLKKYCECFSAVVPCSDKCRCIDCKNDSGTGGGAGAGAGAGGKTGGGYVDEAEAAFYGGWEQQLLGGGEESGHVESGGRSGRQRGTAATAAAAAPKAASGRGLPSAPSLLELAGEVEATEALLAMSPKKP